MQEARVTAAHPRPVVITMVDGTTKQGAVQSFAPDAPNLIFEERGADIGSKRSVLPSERIAYLAFGRTRLPPLCIATGSEVELRIHAVGGQTFIVRVIRTALGHPLGFFAHPSDANSPYQELYFYSSGVNAKEDTAPIGAMLVEDGALDSTQVKDGVSSQTFERKVPIGEILVQHKRVTEDDVDAACAAGNRKNLRIGEVLVDLGMLTEDDVSQALAEQKKRRGKRLGEIFVEMGILQETALFRTLARKFHMPFVDLDEVRIDPEAAKSVPRELVEKYCVLPLEHREGTLTIAISDPLQTEVYDVLRFQGHLRIREVLATKTQLRRVITARPAHEASNEVDEILEALEAESVEFRELAGRDDEVRESDSAVVRLANQMILDGWRKGASDIHVEPNGRDHNTIIRFRTDGECSIYQPIPAAFRQSLVARLKIMAQLDISERRKPQDGKIKFDVGSTTIELRVATIPTVDGNEDVVMRILAGSKPLPLDKMGLNERNLREFRNVITNPYGLVLCVGPTGSGKTTTLHSALGYINRVETKIWTAEDPVEITQRGLRQVQVRPKIGFTFAAAMRAFLRADPDVIMIGEMRDEETASIAVEASLTGHLVFSTLHTNTAPETVTRLLDMGLDPFTFADAMQGVMAQRLTRSLCKDCRHMEAATLDDFDRIAAVVGAEVLRRQLGIASFEDLTLWRASGCHHCNYTGLKGRLALHELLVPTEEIKHAIQSKQTAARIREIAIADGMNTLVVDGIAKAANGKTDVDQVFAVCSR